MGVVFHRLPTVWHVRLVGHVVAFADDLVADGAERDPARVDQDVLARASAV